MGIVKTIDFHGDQLLGVETERGAFVYLKPIVEQMGLDWSAQLKRVKRDAILAEGVAIMAIPPEFGGANDAVFLRLDLFHGWLFTVDSKRVKAGMRDKLLTYQREAYDVLARAFLKSQRHAEVMPAPTEAVTPPEARKLVTEARMSFGERAARQLWSKPACRPCRPRSIRRGRRNFSRIRGRCERWQLEAFASSTRRTRSPRGCSNTRCPARRRGLVSRRSREKRQMQGLFSRVSRRRCSPARM